MVKAASLLYALFISVIVAMFCCGLLLIFSINKRIEVDFERRLDLINAHRSYVEIAFSEFDRSNKTSGPIEIPGYNNIWCSYTQKNWGVFTIVSVMGVSNSDTLNKNYLFSEKWNTAKPVLYLRDNDEALKIAGNTRIDGNIYVSSKGIEKTNIQGGDLNATPKHLGEKYLSEKNLPTTNKTTLVYPQEYEISSLEEENSEEIFNSFNNTTKVIEVGNSLSGFLLKGNIIIKSSDTLHISKTTSLIDVIVDAPKIVFEKGFKGNAQVFASKEIIVDSTAQLDYPSVLVISANPFLKKRVVCHAQSLVSGAILLFGEGLTGEKNNSIVLEKETRFHGELFCDGILSLYGEVFGSVYTSSIMYKNETTSYQNLILNGKIRTNKISSEFFQVPYLENRNYLEPIAIKQL